MPETNKTPEECMCEIGTDFQLLTALVPDIKDRINKMKVDRPVHFEELQRRAIESETGWRPLHWWRGCL